MDWTSGSVYFIEVINEIILRPTRDQHGLRQVEAKLFFQAGAYVKGIHYATL